MISRNTVQREIILGAVGKMCNHPTAEEVYNYISKDNPTISKATVYRNLKQLSEAGDLLHIGSVENADRYDHNKHKHYHFQCENCQRVFDVEMDYDENILERVDDTRGFTFISHDIVFKGLCPSCKK